MREIECAPMPLAEAERLLRAAVDRLVDELALAGSEPEITATREWTPMDHVQPPWCPYVDISRRRVAGRDASIELEQEQAHWNENELARASMRLSVRSAAGEWSIAFDTQGSASDHVVTTLFVRGDAPRWLLAEFEGPPPR